MNTSYATIEIERYSSSGSDSSRVTVVHALLLTYYTHMRNTVITTMLYTRQGSKGNKYTIIRQYATNLRSI